MDNPNRPEERPTLKTIAAQTGLAVATVSRALKDAPDIGEETKRRVRAVAEKVGYRPNRAGVRLRTGKTNVIAVVLSTAEDVMNHTARLIYSVAEALKGTQYHLVVMPYFPADDPMTPIRYIVETGSADGVIINQTIPDDPRVRYMHDRGIPFATHGRTDMGIDHPYFDFDNEAFGRLAVRELVRRGRKRLALLAPPKSQSYSQHMIHGFRDEAALLGVEAVVIDAVDSDNSTTQVQDFALEYFTQSDRPDGLIVASSQAAMAMVAGAELCQQHIGQDFDLVSKEAIRFLSFFRREMIVMQEDVSRAGSFLAHAVVKAIERQATGEAEQYLDRPDGFE
ncbi:MAG: transcriptional regulator [Cereibacter sphaeroides]|uniref:Transcriptional regulator n=1 Tax=Cereibacter sphaeroides TaxID=1063 RepID=A0A2W5UCE1_CERSP|nr:MAG: transcriptional regulator [Cereibacter sphaeroides]